MSMPEVDVCVIGAGISGLTVAHRLSASGIAVRVLERASGPGGVIASRRDGERLVEGGPNSAMGSTGALTALISELGLDGERVTANPAASRRFILRDGVLVPIPTSPPAAIRSPLLSARGKLRLLREPFIRRAPEGANESVGAFVRRRLGDEAEAYGVNPFVAGVFAGDPDLLEMRSAFPRLQAMETRAGSLVRAQITGLRQRKRSGTPRPPRAGMFSFRDGMQTLTDALARSVDVTADATVTSVTRAPDGYRVSFIGPEGELALDTRAVVVATDADSARRIVRGLAPEIDVPLREIPYAPVAIVTSEYRRDDVRHPLDGFGFLIPAREDRRILGTIFSSTLFPHRASGGHALLTTFVGGMRRPPDAALPDDELRGLVAAELRDLLGAGAPVDVTVTRRPRAIPQYTMGHEARIERITAVEARYPGLHLCANYRGGISVGDCVASAEATAAAVLTRLG